MAQWHIIMFNSIVLGVKQQRFRRYSEAFNFFQSKSINMVIGSRKLDYVVHYRDLQFLDDETEYFKRYYGTTETSTRIKKLINYYEINMTPPAPNLLPIHNYHILETRTRKLLKLCIMREKSLARRSIVHQEQEDQEDSDANMILSQLNNSNYSAPSSNKEENSDDESFDSQPHNAYENDPPSPRNQPVQEINLREHPDFLVLEFKLSEEPPKINILPPQPPLLPEKTTASVAIQTLPFEPPPQKKTEKEERKESETRAKEKERQREKWEKQREKERQREKWEKQRERWERDRERSREERERAKMIRPAESKLISSPVAIDGLGIRSQIKNDNVILTESIELIRSPNKEEKKKSSTFMEYYNSIPVKNPTNILEKFIKRKK